MEKTLENSQDGKFKLPNFKIVNLKEEIDQAIKRYAKKYLDVYDERFSEEEQCSGYFAFKELVLMRTSYPLNYSEMAYGQPGFYLLSRFHPNIRESAFLCARKIRLTFKIHQDIN